MWAFLASDCMFFGCLISTHLIYRLHPPPGALPARDVFSIELTSFSTFILLMSSLMMALAVNAIQKGNLKSLRASLLTTIFFGCIFLGCQVYEFRNFVFEKHLTITQQHPRHDLLHPDRHPRHPRGDRRPLADFDAALLLHRPAERRRTRWTSKSWACTGTSSTSSGS